MTETAAERGAAILDRLRNEALLAENAGDKPVLARSFRLAIEEIERLTRANDAQRELLKVAYDTIADKNLRLVNIRGALDADSFVIEQSAISEGK